MAGVVMAGVVMAGVVMAGVVMAGIVFFRRGRIVGSKLREIRG